MPPLSVSKATVTELFNGSAKFGRPSKKAGAGWIVTADKGNTIILKLINQDGTIVYVVRWTNYMGADGLNGRILPGLPIHRSRNSVYFKTSSTTTLGGRHKAPFCFKFETEEEAEVFEMWWLSKNGSIASWKEKEAEAKKKAGSNSNLPLQEKTNTVSSSIKRKAGPMTNGPMLKIKKLKDGDFGLNLLLAIGGSDSNNDAENQPGFLLDGSANDVAGDDSISPNPHSVGAFKTVGSMPAEVKIKGKVRSIVKVKRYALESITEDLIDNLNDKDQNDLNKDNNSKDSNDGDNDSSNDGVDVLIDEEDAPQSQNWTTAFASYE